MRRAYVRVLVPLLLFIVITLLKLQDFFSNVDKTVYASLPMTRNLAVIILSETASIPVQVVLIAFLAFVNYRRRRLSFSWLAPLVIGFVAVNLSSLTMKLLVAEPRPPSDLVYPAKLGPLDTYSFPSGHTARAAFLAHLLAPRRLLPSSCLYAYAVAIGLTRLVLSVHWLSDVLCGFVLGILIAELVKVFYPSPSPWKGGARSKVTS